MTAKQLLLVSSLYLVLALIILVAVPTCSVKAGQLSWDHQATPQKAKYKRRTPRYYAAPKPEYENGWRCLEKVRVVGSQWIGNEGAEESARKAWMEDVRWRHGEAFMDMANARDYEKRCSRSSVGEAVGQTLIRCEIWARPCKQPMAGTVSK